MDDSNAPRRDPTVLAVAAFAVSLPIARPVVFKVGPSGVQLADLILVAVWLIAIGRALTGHIKPRFGAIFYLPVAYLATQLLSLVVAHKLGFVAVLKLGAYAEMVLLPWLLSHVVKDAADVRYLVRAVAIGALLAVGIGLVGFGAFYVHRPLGDAMMCGWGGIKAGNYPRLCAPFNNPNLYLNYLTTTCPLLIVALADRLAFSRGVSAFGAWALLGAMGFVALFTLSAGVGGFAIAGAGGIVAWRRYRGHVRGLFDVALGSFAALLAVFFLSTMVATLQPHGEGHFSVGHYDVKLMDGMRPPIWKGTRLRENWVTGVGYGEPPAITSDPRSFTPPDRLKDIVGPVTPHAMDAHDVALSVLGQSGVLGFAAFVAALFALVRGPLTQKPAPRAAEQRLLRAAVAWSFLGALVYHGLVGSFEEARHLWITLGLGVVADLLGAPAAVPSRTGEGLRPALDPALSGGPA
jgi:hypothetical protein